MIISIFILKGNYTISSITRNRIFSNKGHTRISTRMTLSHNGRIIMLSNIGKLKHLAGRLVRAVRIAVACWKGFAESVNGIHPNAFLNV